MFCNLSYNLFLYIICANIRIVSFPCKLHGTRGYGFFSNTSPGFTRKGIGTRRVLTSFNPARPRTIIVSLWCSGRYTIALRSEAPCLSANGGGVFLVSFHGLECVKLPFRIGPCNLAHYKVLNDYRLVPHGHIEIIFAL